MSSIVDLRSSPDQHCTRACREHLEIVTSRLNGGASCHRNESHRLCPAALRLKPARQGTDNETEPRLRFETEAAIAIKTTILARGT